MKNKTKAHLAKNKGVDHELLEESLKLYKRLQKNGITIRKAYGLRSPFEKRLVKVSSAELVQSAE